jgi:glycosyltransferase involved in cell wall biosynthesis
VSLYKGLLVENRRNNAIFADTGSFSGFITGREMRILHLVRVFGYGGAENHVRDLANIMDEMGHQVYIMARRGNQNELLNQGVRFIEMQMSDLSAPFRVFEVARFIRQNNIDVVHVHQRLPAFIGIMAAWLAGVPSVVTIHGKTQYDVRLPLTRRLTGKFIFVRQSTLDEASGFGIPADKCVLIQNGVRIEVGEQAGELRSISYISRIDKRHGMVISMIMNKAVKELSGRYPGLTFHIAGDGDQLSELKAQAERINELTGRETVILEGYLPDTKVLIKRSGLVFGVGRAAIETLACGVPLFSVNQKYFGGLVSQENYDFFRKNNFVAYGLEAPDEQKIADELERYLKDPSFWRSEAASLQKRIDEDFNIYRIVSSIINIYSELKNSGKS